MPDYPETPSAVEAGAILTIDLGAVRENYRRLRSRSGPAECAAVVKSNGYGLSAATIATALRKEGCRTFFVAHASEGLSLRRALGSGPAIYILNGVHPGAEESCMAGELIAVANSAAQLAAWKEAAQRQGKHNVPVVVQIDSGMSRLGMSPAEVEEIAADMSAFEGLDLCLVISHLACADEPSNPSNEAQRLTFERLRRLLPSAPASLANSSGIYLGEPYHFDLVRPGAALYGINPTPGKVNPMLPVVGLQAKVIQTRRLDTDIGVGYGHAFRATGPLEIATIALGYGDGWPRRAAAAAWVDGEALPFVGRVSMDSIVIDISALPPHRLRPGDLVELIGPRQTVDDLASCAQTIGYEILTGLGWRFHRRYLGG